MLAVLSDIHSNLQALDAVLAECRARGVTQFACLGDIVGYGANPSECVQRIRELNCPTVKGNHDHYAATGKLDDDVSPLARAGLEYSMEHITEADREWLRALPSIHRLSPLITLVHSSLHEPAEWHYVRICRMAEDSFDHQETPVCFFGHTHVPQIFTCRGDEKPESLEPVRMRFEKDQRYLVNPGSVGQPRNGEARAQFAIFNEETLELQLLRVPYDVDTAARAIREAGLPDQLADRLREGF